MIDRREDKSGECEKFEELAHLSDTDIVLEFARAMTNIYPNLLKIEAHCYDPYDDISETLYYNFMYLTFAGKHGIPVINGEHHKFSFGLHCYRKITHIECKPKSYPIKIDIAGDEVLIEKDMEGKVFCLAEIGPKGISLSGSIEKSELPDRVVFDHVKIAIAEKETGYRFKDPKFAGVYGHIEDWEFNFVPENYSKKEHQHFIDRFYEDLKS